VKPIILATLAACATAPSLADFEQHRTIDLAVIRAAPPADRARALRERILRDSIQAKYAAYFGDGGFASEAKAINADDLKFFYLWAPARERVGEDYVALGDALVAAGDVEGAIHAYEDAIAVAEGYVPNAEAASRVRLAALRAEQALWEGRHEPMRARAAKVMADGEDAWLRGPEAQAARRDFDQLVEKSHDAMNDEVAAQNARALQMLNQQLNNIQTTLTTLPTAHAGGAAAAQMSAITTASVLIDMAQRTLATFAKTSPQLRGGELAPLDDVVTAIPGLSGAIDGAAAGNSDGKRALATFARALVRLRRGDAIAAVMAEVRANAPAAPSPPPPPPTAAAPKPSVEDRLHKLDELHANKAITDEEYARERERILKEGL
jgi:hypothetical protein